MDFVHLHAHSEYSLPVGLDGYNSPADMIARAAELGQTALALTDHGNMYGVVDFYTAAKKHGIKPIFGMEGYVSAQSRHIKEQANRKSHHLLMLAQTDQGYRNLMKLNTLAWFEGKYYGRPRMDHELLAQYHEGIIVTSACIGGEINSALRDDNDPKKARELAAWYRDLFQGRYYLELQYHPTLPILDDLNTELARIGAELGIPLVVTTDSHFAKPDYAEAHRFLNASRLGKTLDQMCELKPDLDPTLALCTVNDLWPHFKRFGTKPFDNTVAIAHACNVTFNYGTVKLPPFPIPEGHTAESYLRVVAEEGLVQRIHPVTEEYVNRLAYELDVINKTGFPDYMLIVWDMVKYARTHDIPSLPRGSAGASLVLYCLGLTDVDPLENGLLFERFLSAERPEMPDIDIDFADSRRAEIFEYLAHTYGRENTAQIMTYGTLGPKQALRDAGKTLNIPLPEVDRIAKLVHTKANTLDDARSMNPELDALIKGDSMYRDLAQKATWIQNRVKSTGTHACGIVISADPLEWTVPLQPTTKNDGIMASFEGPTLAKLGLLKMDVLGLTNLSVIADTLQSISRLEGYPFTLADIPLDDKTVFESLGRGETANVFQLESAGMTRYLMELKPTRVGDLYAMVALYRPGPLEQIPNYIQGKNNPKTIKYLHPILKPILEDTYGVIVYQEQIMLLLQAIAGYTLGEAYIVLKAIGKKNRELMASEEPRFKQGCLKKGLTQQQAEILWDLIQPFAGYSFNRPHSTLYGLLSYQTAWLKIHYPAEYMAATLSHDTGDIASVALACAESERLGVSILPPSVNESEASFAVVQHGDKQVIRFGLGAIKNVGEGPVAAILAERATNGSFNGLADLIRRSDRTIVTKRVVEALVKSGACDQWGLRHALVRDIPDLLKERKRATTPTKAKKPKTTTISLFDDSEFDAPIPAVQTVEERIYDDEDTHEWRMERLEWERELLGFYLSAHPIKEVWETLRPEAAWFKCAFADRVELKTTVHGVAMIRSCKTVQTKKGDSMAVLTLFDETGDVSAVLFPKTYATIDRSVLVPDTIVGYRAKTDHNRGEFQLILDAIGTPDVARNAPRLRLRSIELIDATASTFPDDESFVINDFVHELDLSVEDDSPLPQEPPARLLPIQAAPEHGIAVLVLPRQEAYATRRLLAMLQAMLRSAANGPRRVYLQVPTDTGYAVLQAHEQWSKTFDQTLLDKMKNLNVTVLDVLPPMTVLD